VDYTLNFYEASGSHLPTGTFFQDLTNPFSDVISISWNGFSFTFDYPSSEDLFYNLQQYTMFDQNQASILAPCAGANYSEEEVMILEGCAGQGYLVDWRGLGYSNTNGFTTWRFYLGFPGADNSGDNEFALAFGDVTDPLIDESGSVSTSPVTTSSVPEPGGLILLGTVIGLVAVMRRHSHLHWSSRGRSAPERPV